MANLLPDSDEERDDDFDATPAPETVGVYERPRSSGPLWAVIFSILAGIVLIALGVTVFQVVF